MGRVSFTTKDGKRVSFNTGKKSSKKSTSKQRRSSKPRTKQKVNKQHKRSTRSVPKKKKSSGKRSSGKKSFIDRIPILNNKTVQKVGFGLGMGLVAKELIDLAAQFAPEQISRPLKQNQRIITLAVEAATEPISAIADIVLSSGTLQKTIGSMSNGRGMTQTINQDMVGFA